jgi:ATP-dependent phosphoenolpyruvate carboxykinase
MTIASGQGIETSTGALAINTGEYTGRSPWIDLSLKTVLLKTKFGGESEYSF